MTGVSIGLAGCLQSAGFGDSGGSPKVRHASVAPLTEYDNLFFRSEYLKKNVMPNVGDKYESKWTQIQGTPLIANALGAKEQDIGVLAFSSMANAMEKNAIPEGFSVIAGCVWGGWTKSPPRYSNHYSALKGSEIKSIEDLKGKSLAINAKGAAVDVIARIALKNKGIDPKNDISIQEVGFGAIPSALREKRVDCGVLLQPFHYQMAQKDEIQTVFESEAAVPNYQYLVYVARDGFLKNDSDSVKMWLEDYWETLKWWSSPSNRDKMLDIATNIMDMDHKMADAILQTKRDYYHGEKSLAPDLKGLKTPIKEMVNLGFLNKMPDVEGHVDPSYLPKGAK